MIFYFSATGNTRWAAEELAKNTGDRLYELASLDWQALPTLMPDEQIGICFPVHAWRPPLLVRTFARALGQRLPEARGHYLWALCTAGDDIGETMDILEDELREGGLTADCRFSLLMPESYVGLPFMDVDNTARESEKLAQARADLDACIASIKRREHGAERLHLSRWPRTNSRLLGAAFYRWLITDKPFVCHNERCSRCQRCAKVCPVGNIVIGDDGHPQWLHNGRCLTCFACYHHCPAHAIEWGRQTKKKGQYFYGKNKNKR